MRVFCKGFNLYGQLGLPEQIVENFSPVFVDTVVKDIFVSHSFSVLQTDNNDFLIFFENRKRILDSSGSIFKICCNDEKIIVLTDHGKLHKIELDNFDTVHEMPNILPTEESDEKIVNVACGSKLYIAISNKGKLFCIPNMLNFNAEHVIDVRCGKEHCILLDKYGNVYTFGRGSRGQLGHGHLGDESEPLQVDALSGIEIVHIAAGGWHTCAVSKDGDLYTWGWNGNGQLGLASAEETDKTCVAVMALPHVADVQDLQRNCTKVACGSRHTIVLLDNNTMYGCGWNKYKQLINQDKENLYSFTYLHDCSDQDVVQLKCGPWNSLIVCK